MASEARCLTRCLRRLDKSGVLFIYTSSSTVAIHHGVYRQWLWMQPARRSICCCESTLNACAWHARALCVGAGLHVPVRVRQACDGRAYNCMLPRWLTGCGLAAPEWRRRVRFQPLAVSFGGDVQVVCHGVGWLCGLAVLL